MTVTIYKNLAEVKNGFYRDVNFIFERIRNGASKDLVIKIRSNTGDITELKKKLPAINFQGKFKERNDLGMIEFSCLMILDFDKFSNIEEANEFKNAIFQDSYVFAAFISPSGKGVKVILKIPNEPDKYKSYFDGANTYFSSDNFDSKNGNLSRLCFESYDSDLLHRNDSKVFDILEVPNIEEIGVFESSLPIKSDSRIIDNLVKWWEGKYPMGNGSRNNNIFVLASAFNDFGINETEAERVLLGYQEKDFKASEIKSTIKSAYRKKSSFGTKFFEDTEAKRKIEGLIRNGKTKKK